MFSVKFLNMVNFIIFRFFNNLSICDCLLDDVFPWEKQYSTFLIEIYLLEFITFLKKLWFDYVIITIVFFFQLSCEYFKFELGNHKKKLYMIFFLFLFLLVGFDETSKKNTVNEFYFSRSY